MEATLEQLDGQAAEKRPEPPKRRRSSKARWFAVVLLAAITGAGAWAWFHYRGRVTTDDAQVDGHITPIAAKIPGSVAEILVDDNVHVKAGEVVVRIDPRDYESRVTQNRAALAMAESQAHGARITVPLTSATTEISGFGAGAQLSAATADLLKARTDYERSAAAELQYARANVATQQATFDRARSDLERMKPLAAQDEISKFQLDQYAAAARVAETQLQAAKERVTAAEKQADSAKAAFEAAQGRVDQARAAVEQTRANRKQVDISASQAATASASVLQARANLQARELELSYTTIVAPINGVVTRKTVQVGQIVQPGQSLMTIIPLDDVWVTANFKETQLAHVRPGQKAEIYIDMYRRKFPARVDSIAGATGTRLSVLPPENASGNYVKVVQRIPVKLVFERIPEGYALRPGMNVEATILTQ